MRQKNEGDGDEVDTEEGEDRIVKEITAATPNIKEGSKRKMRTVTTDKEADRDSGDDELVEGSRHPLYARTRASTRDIH